MAGIESEDDDTSDGDDKMTAVADTCVVQLQRMDTEQFSGSDLDQASGIIFCNVMFHCNFFVPFTILICLCLTNLIAKLVYL